MIDKLLKMALFGGEPILYLLIALSLISVAVIIERWLVYRRNRVDLPALASDVVQKLNQGDLDGARSAAATRQSAETRVLREGLDNFDQGAVVAAELMASMRTRQQQHLNRRLIVLGSSLAIMISNPLERI
jgi:biopolymer transport protein ExbB/TolQ